MVFEDCFLGSWLSFCICLVCGNRSTGIHYGVVSCEGCKAFYKRGLVKSTSYKCYFGKTCSVNVLTGNRCKACRFQKCVEAGMDVQVAKRGRTRKHQVPTEKSNENGDIESSGSPSTIENTKGTKFSEVEQVLPNFDEQQHLSSGRFSKGFPTQNSNIVTGGSVSNARTITTNPFASFINKRMENVSIKPFRNQQIDSIPFRANQSGPCRTNQLESIRTNQSESIRTDLSRVEPTVTALSQLSPNSRWTFQKPIDVPDYTWLNRATLTNPDKQFRDLNGELSDERRQNLSGFLSGHWEIIQKRGFFISNTIGTVFDAVKVVYHDQLTEWSEFMHEAVNLGNVPHQPQVTLQGMIEIVRDSVADCLRRGCRFLYMLPGFSDLDQTDQKILLMEKFSETWLIVHAPYLLNKESYYLVGPQDNKVHYSQYWMRQLLEQPHREIIFSWTEKIKDLKLNLVEYFILLAVATFRPETTTAKNKNLLSFLHAHYLECLLHSIRSRCSESERTIIETKLWSFMTLFRSVYRLGNVYVRSLDYTRTPFQAVKGSTVITPREALLAENDGLLMSDT